jgi:tRNA dimethylallyltransferase
MQDDLTGKVALVTGASRGIGRAAALALARSLGTEVISADSMLVYRGMDIGTDKPSPEVLSEVVHHLINIREPEEEFSAGEFLKEAVPVIDRLHARGKVPVVAGGTGLYIKAMTRGLFSAPGADRGLREVLLGAEEARPGELHARLRRLDPEAARLIEPADTRRIVRALEVVAKTGSPASELKRTATDALPYEFIKIGISRERAELYGLLDARVDRMLREGLIEEVRRVLSRQMGGPSRTAMQAIGYKEIARHLAGEYGIEEARRLIMRNTRRYAKRQFTWFRKEDGVRWVDATGIHTPEGVFKLVRAALPEDIL